MKNQFKTKDPGCQIAARRIRRSPSGNAVRSGHGYRHELKVRDVLEIFRVRSEEREVPLDSLCGKPQVLDAKVWSAGGSGQFCCEHAEDFSGFGGNAEQRLATHP